jgi:hypothetical protein
VDPQGPLIDRGHGSFSTLPLPLRNASARRVPGLEEQRAPLSGVGSLSPCDEGKRPRREQQSRATRVTSLSTVCSYPGLLGPAVSGGGHELLGQLRAVEVLRERRHPAHEQHTDFFGGQR